MPEKDLIKEETTSAKPSAEGSAEEELLSTSEASKLTGASARTLKRRADLGTLCRTSVHTQFGIESRYYKRELLKLIEETRRKRAEMVAEVNAEVKGRHASGADLQVAGGDKQLHSVAELADVTRLIDQKIAKITEPLLKMANAFETGFEKLLCFQEQATQFQTQMIKIEADRDREKARERGERQQGRKATIKAKEQERRANLVRLICYLILSIVFCGFVGFMIWKIRGEMLLW